MSSNECGKQKVSLDDIAIASPCSMKWDDMQGDNRVRMCGGCAKNVFNISAMSKSEAEKFLSSQAELPCMTFYRRKDGTIITNNCPVGLRAIHDKARIAFRLVAGLLSLLFCTSTVSAQSSRKMGKPMMHSSVEQQPTESHINSNQQTGVQTYSNSSFGTHASAANGSVSTQSAITRPAAVRNYNSGRSVPIPIKASANSQKPVDTEAHEFFDKGNKAMAKGEKQLAGFFYEKALDVIDKQKNADPKFRAHVQDALSRVNRE